VRQVIISLGFLALVPAAQAQMGPSAPRVIIRPMPSLAPSGVQTFSAEARVVVSRKGRVESAEIIKGSGDPAFDKQWHKVLSDWRYVPAVDAAGEPVEGSTTITYSNAGISDRPELPGGGEAPARNTVSEAQRIERLTCKDFLWEYYIVTNAMSRRMALLDPLLKTPLVMFMTEAQLNETQQASLRPRYDGILDDVAKQCRDNAEASFWSAVMKPALQASIAN
jgi:TonB family protein